ncbi:polysaccharide deacetylase family protein [Nitratireductor indicus]|uniref:polysaccharide deacetylase family protein n=1 Tax=Nitratireductor indicus TaxID=721133 RepID=UPI0028759910|nr:polysaccharide deacetylase family protein [Nitratireductor indicus]MDS1136437.1 polysaccharide deacetylase family protein [Nitratireductor indicus]
MEWRHLLMITPERDFIGYGENWPDPKWPNGARLALQFVMNYEEGAEYGAYDGFKRNEIGLADTPGGRVPGGQRDMAFESMYEFGSRVGVWRIFRLFAERKLPLTVFACAVALERNRHVVSAMQRHGFDLCCHGLRWEEHFTLSRDEEKQHIAEAVALIERLTGQRPLGWYCRYGASEHTRALLAEEGGFVYDSDSYSDELPYWTRVGGKDHLVVPYSLDTNDTKLAPGGGISSGEAFFQHLKENFDFLRAEGAHTPRMMSVGLHARIVGRPGKALGLARFLDYVSQHEDVWIASRLDIARHWQRHHPAPAAG